MNELTLEEATRLFTYDPETGLVTRRVRAAQNAKAGQVVGCLNGHGYLVVRVTLGGSGSQYGVHRLAWLLHTGEWPKNQIDHINGIRTDNRITNLRDVTSQQNQFNLHGSKRNKSGSPGVSWVKRIGRWKVGIQADKKKRHLGYFTDIADASAAYAAAKAKLHLIHGVMPNMGCV